MKGRTKKKHKAPNMGAPGLFKMSDGTEYYRDLRGCIVRKSSKGELRLNWRQRRPRRLVIIDEQPPVVGRFNNAEVKAEPAGPAEQAADLAQYLKEHGGPPASLLDGALAQSRAPDLAPVPADLPAGLHLPPEYVEAALEWAKLPKSDKGG